MWKKLISLLSLCSGLSLPAPGPAAAGLLASGAMLSLLEGRALAQAPEENWLTIEKGHSVIFDQNRSIRQIILGDPAIIDIESLSPDQFRIKGLEVGSTNIWVVYADSPGNPANYQVTVHQDLSDLIRRIDSITGGVDSPKAYPVNGRLVVEGAVSDVQSLEQIAAVSRLYDEEFVNLMSVGGDHQVQLQVVFAEVNRSGLRELGLNALWGDNNIGIGLQTPTQVGSPLVQSAITGATDLNAGIIAPAFSDSFNILGTFSDLSLTAILSILEQNGISKILAQPTLTALSGQQAEFLAGGEVPIPVAQSGNRVSIDFKEYGVKMTFIPTVLGAQVIDMRVYIEVSELDNTNAIRLTGIEIPAFVSRKTSSHLRLESGMTFAMAGMLHETTRATSTRIPILGDIPILGTLFRSESHLRDETELMIFVTPRLVRPMSPEEVPAPPGTTENNNPNDFELFLLGLDHRVGSRTAEPTDSSAPYGGSGSSQPSGPIGLAR